MAVYSYIAYKSGRDRDRINAEVMADPRLKSMMPRNSMPFDGMRKYWEGIRSLVEL